MVASRAVAVLVVLAVAVPARAVVHNIAVSNFLFNPANVTVNIGDTVRWNWVNGSHTATSGINCIPDGKFNGAVASFNTTFDYVIPGNAPATIPYFCDPHCGLMEGVINVTLPPPAPALGSSAIAAIFVSLTFAAALLLHRRQGGTQSNAVVVRT